MKLHLREFVDGQVALQQLGQLDVPAITAYKIMKNIKLIEIETQPYWDIRKKLLDPYADGNGIVTWPDDDGETMKEVNDQLEPILDEEVDVDIKALPIKALGEIDVKPALLYGAWFMFTD